MKKHLITLILALACILALAVCVSAKEYTVTSNSEYQAAYASAVNGDTLIVNGKLTCDIQANKSITYVLKADWESSKLVVDQSNVEVSFIADGGNYKIMPTNYSTTQGWLNIAAFGVSHSAQINRPAIYSNSSSLIRSNNNYTMS